MSNRITFQFDSTLGYQQQAVASVVDLFDGLVKKTSGLYANVERKDIASDQPVRNLEIVEGSRLLENLRAVQLSNNLFADDEIKGNNFTVEMETGTGKTYVYLRTILTLFETYGFTKFMIVVPSIAIRTGVMKSIEMLSEHFKALHNMDIAKHSFVYDSKNPKTVSSSFVEKTTLSICVINIQAFNKDNNKIRTSDEYGMNLWEDIRAIRPIIIIDEPQKIEGTKVKKSASLKALEDVNPLFTLRYSATHKQLYNQVYKLDSFAAYQNNLVKSIEVKTVHGVIDKGFPYVRYVDFVQSELKARIEIFTQEQGGTIKKKTFAVRGGAPLQDLAGGLAQYANYRTHEDPHKLKPLKIESPAGMFELAIGQSNFEITQNEAVRIQIQLAIQSHLDKQMKMIANHKKIKVLTLFFIDAVSRIRDTQAEDGRGEYLRIFDEEYEKIIAEPKYQAFFTKNKALFPQYRNTQQVREGYFAIDNKKAAVDVEGWDSTQDDADVKIKAKSQEDIDRGISLILEKKDELISFHEPLAFIFSHSALREGWDNPNVFTLCTLKSGSSEIAKKQEIGRGLRLPVDVDGVQNRSDTDINQLTVIANDYYEHFAENLQRDFNDSMSFNKDEVTADIIMATLRKAGIPVAKITSQLVDVFREELFFAGVINEKNLLTGNAKKIADISFANDTLNEHAILIRDAFAACMVEKGSRKIPIANGDNEPVENGQHSYVSEEAFKQMLESLHTRLAKRTIYHLELDNDEFIASCIEEINSILATRRIQNQYSIETGQAEFDVAKRMMMSEAKTRALELAIEDGMPQKSDFEIINTIMYHTSLPRFAIIKMLSGIEKKALLSNQDILEIVMSRIALKLSEAKARSITKYEVIDEYEFSERTIFEIDRIDEAMLLEAKKVYETKGMNRKAINRYYRTDSDGEWDFADQLEDDEQVLLYTKMKKGGFVIDTPYGNYSPDWAIVYRKATDDIRLYFVVETKKDKEWDNLTPVEQYKIRCGKLHFKAASEDARFDWVKDYEDFRYKFNV